MVSLTLNQRRNVSNDTNRIFKYSGKVLAFGTCYLVSHPIGQEADGSVNCVPIGYAKVVIGF